MTEIEGPDVHSFTFVNPSNAIPVIVTTVGRARCSKSESQWPLTDPTAHGGSAEAPSMCCSIDARLWLFRQAHDCRWGPDHTARIWAALMKRLGYKLTLPKVGDWGSPVSSAMARLAPQVCSASTSNLPAVVPPEIAAILAVGGPCA